MHPETQLRKNLLKAVPQKYHANPNVRKIVDVAVENVLEEVAFSIVEQDRIYSSHRRLWRAWYRWVNSPIDTPRYYWYVAKSTELMQNRRNTEIERAKNDSAAIIEQFKAEAIAQLKEWVHKHERL